MSLPKRIEESRITLTPSSGSKGELVHGVYASPSFPSIKIPVTIEWSSSNETEIAGILKHYKVLESAPEAVRPRCLGFFEASEVGRIGFVFVDRDLKAQLSLRDLIRFKPKPDRDTRNRLALAVVSCVQRTWELTEGKCECHLWSGSVRFLDWLHPSEIPLSATFLSEFAPPIVSPIHSDREHLLYLPPRMWDPQDPLRADPVKNLSRAMRWALGIILLEIADWRSFRDMLFLNEDSSKSEMFSAVSKFCDITNNPIYRVKSTKVTEVVGFCLNGDCEDQGTVSEYCTSIKQMLWREERLEILDIA